MKRNLTELLQLGRGLSGRWILAALIIVAAVLFLAAQPALANPGVARINQTVPPPPATATTPPLPNPTPVPSSGGSGGSSNSSGSAEAATPVPTQEAAQPGAALTAKVAALTLNVRQGPGTTFPVIGRLKDGAEVTVLARNTAGDWWQICCLTDTQTKGWVSAELLTPAFTAEQAAQLPVEVGETAAPAATPTVTAAVTATAATAAGTAAPASGGQTGTVNAVTLNIRSAPNTTTAAVVGKLKQGETVSVLGRSQAGDWYQVCCVPGAQTNGWVSAQYITPAFDAAALAVVDENAAAAPAATPAAGAAVKPVTPAAPAAAAASSPSLTIDIAQEPPFAVQGKEIALVYTVTNHGSDPAANVVLRSELPRELNFVAAGASAGGVVSQEKGANNVQIVVRWPELGAGKAGTATLRVQVSPDLANGTVFDNLAQVTADQGLQASGGVSIGLPPALLPLFW